MKTPLLALALFAIPLLGGEAYAAATCRLPEGATAQPQQALHQKLEAEGWRIERIRPAGGCYRVLAVKADGTRLKTEFNAATLEDVRGAAAPGEVRGTDTAQIDSFLAGLQGGPGGGGGDDDDDDDDDDDRRRSRDCDHEDDD